ncbi:hypothetical protein D6777_04505 [Candidatus Woesearchaeota archaeon]|nr:MAG: hypothetical protein D6777_04505 [Candidatus Woesearchaeota archaeon]
MTEILDLVANGFIPEEIDNEDSFKSKCYTTIEISHIVNEAIRTQSNLLESLFDGDVYSIKPNPYHVFACTYLCNKIGIYPIHFINTMFNLGDAAPRGQLNKRIRENSYGVTQYLFYGDVPVTMYSVMPDKKMLSIASVHELYHCTQRSSSNPLKDLKRHSVNHALEEYRAYLIGFSILDDIGKQKQMVSNNLKSGVYNEIKNIFILNPRYDLTIASGSIGTSIISNYLSNTILGSFLTGFFGIIGASYLYTGIKRLVTNRKIESALDDIVELMDNKFPYLVEEFGDRPANFLVYNLYYKEFKDLTFPVRDYLHKDKSFRMQTILEYTEFLKSIS